MDQELEPTTGPPAAAAKEAASRELVELAKKEAATARTVAAQIREAARTEPGNMVQTTEVIKKALAGEARYLAMLEKLSVLSTGGANDVTLSNMVLVSSIPKADNELVPWGSTFYFWVHTYPEELNLTAVRMTEISDDYANYAESVSVLGGGNSSAQLVVQKEAFKGIFVKDCTGLINYQMRNPIFSEAQILASGCQVEKKTRSPDQQLIVIPTMEFNNHARNEVRGKTRKENSTAWKIPDGARRVEYWGGIIASEHEPWPTREQCTIKGSESTSEFLLRLGEGHSGQWIVIYLRYTNHFPVPGPWSGPFATMIP